MLYKKSQLATAAISTALVFRRVQSNPTKVIQNARHSAMISGGTLALIGVVATLSSSIQEQHPGKGKPLDADQINASVAALGIGLLVDGLTLKYVVGSRTQVSVPRAAAFALVRAAASLSGPLVLKGLRAIRSADLPAPTQEDAKSETSEAV